MSGSRRVTSAQLSAPPSRVTCRRRVLCTAQHSSPPRVGGLPRRSTARSWHEGRRAPTMVQTAATPHPACPLRCAPGARVVACRVSGPLAPEDRVDRSVLPALMMMNSITPLSGPCLTAQGSPPNRLCYQRTSAAEKNNEVSRRAAPVRPRAPNPSRRNDQAPSSWPPRLGAAFSPRRARSQSADATAVHLPVPEPPLAQI